jgi:hypothetical protein
LLEHCIRNEEFYEGYSELMNTRVVGMKDREAGLRMFVKWAEEKDAERQAKVVDEGSVGYG